MTKNSDRLIYWQNISDDDDEEPRVFLEARCDRGTMYGGTSTFLGGRWEGDLMGAVAKSREDYGWHWGSAWGDEESGWAPVLSEAMEACEEAIRRVGRVEVG